MRYFFLFFASCLLALNLLPVSAAPAALSVVEQGKSTFSIVVPKEAPGSLRAAASELQQDIKIATGAELPIREDDAAGSTPHISLGATQQARAAGVLQRRHPAEGFSILTRGGNLYIWGPDTPSGETTDNGGISNGTANGVYTFLEDYLDVRWLMPGDLGRDIPRRSTLALPNIDRTQAPGFINRREPYIQNNLPAVRQWQAQQKLGLSFRIDHAHNWAFVTPDMYKEHPDRFPMIDGKRPVPTGRYKLETTNPGLVRFFADRAIEELKANPQKTFSLSPSDSRGWSQSPESLALYDPPPAGSTYPSVTPLILKFYRDVSEIVAREYPQGRLAGYIYADYLFPPTKGDMTLPDNFYPVVAPSINYGYTLYREDVQKQFRDLMGDWAKVTQNLFYYDLPNTVSPSSGALVPAAPEILNTIFPILTANNVKGVYIYGTDSWNNAAMANYMLAKMMWNPKLDAHDLQREWLHRAYGPQAGAEMEKLYAKLDDLFREYYRANDNASYTMTDAMLKDIYAPEYSALEKMFLAAKAQPMTQPQQQRLQMLEDNLVVLQWLLKTKKFLPADFASELQRDETEITDLLFSTGTDFEPFPGMVDRGPAPPALNVQSGAALPSQDKASTVTIRGKSSALLYAARDGEVSITPLRATHGSPFVSYAIKDGQNRDVASGVLSDGKAVTFSAKARTPYFLYIPRGITELSVEGAAVAYATNAAEGGRLHLFGKGTTLYFYVPAGTGKWDLTLSSAVPGETARAVVTAPDGKQSAVLETTTIPAQMVSLEGQEGFWKIEVTEAASGVLDDIYLVFDKKLPQWVSTDPAQPLMILPQAN